MTGLRFLLRAAARAALHERASAMPGRAERHGDGRLDRGSKQQCGCGALPLRGCWDYASVLLVLLRSRIRRR